MKLEDWLSETGMTQSVFAALIGVQGSQVTRWISGERRPGARALEAIGQATKRKVSFTDFDWPPRSNGT